MASNIKPTDPAPYDRLGNAYFLLCLFEEAIEHYKLSLKYDPMNGKVHLNIGQAYSAVNMLKDAENHLKLSL